MITALGYLADACVLATYFFLARTGRPRAFHWANAIGCVPIIIGEVALGAYVPLVLTVTFGVLGWFGVWTTRKRCTT